MKYLIEFVGSSFSESGVGDLDNIDDRMIEMVEGGDESDYDFWWSGDGFIWLDSLNNEDGEWKGNNLSIKLESE